jgi:hypothetical protein
MVFWKKQAQLVVDFGRKPKPLSRVEMSLQQGGAKLHFKSLESRVVDQRIQRSLNGKEREFYLGLARKIPPENIMNQIGAMRDSMRSREEKMRKERVVLTKSVSDLLREVGADLGNGAHDDGKANDIGDLLDACRDLRENAVVWQRNIELSLDIFAAIRDSGANPQMLYRVLFRHAQGKLNPIRSDKAVIDWNFLKSMHLDLGKDYFKHFAEPSREELYWLSKLPVRNRFSSELEMLDLICFQIESDEGRQLIEHLHCCKSSFCRCNEGMDRLNAVIGGAKKQLSYLEEKFRICDALIRESDDEVRFRFVKVVLGAYDELNEIDTQIGMEENAAERRAKEDPDASAGNVGSR